MSNEKSETNSTEKVDRESGDKFETLAGMVIAIFAAILSLNSLGAGKFGDDEQNAIIEKSNQFSWYQAKSIKKSLADSQADTLSSLMDAGLVSTDRKESIDKLVEKLRNKAEKYDRETRVILDGSSKYRNEPWFASADDDMKDVTGAKEHEQTAAELGRAGDMFDYGELFLQLCVVFGAICLVLKGSKARRSFFTGMILLGLIGTAFTCLATAIAWKHI